MQNWIVTVSGDLCQKGVFLFHHDDKGMFASACNWCYKLVNSFNLYIVGV